VVGRLSDEITRVEFESPEVGAPGFHLAQSVWLCQTSFRVPQDHEERHSNARRS
jgi:hypothetical protein